MDDLLRGDCPVHKSSVPTLRSAMVILAYIPAAPVLFVVTLVRDTVIGGDSVAGLFGLGCCGGSRQAGLVQRAASKTAVMVATCRYIGFKEGWTNDALARHFIPPELVQTINFSRSCNSGFAASLPYAGFLMARTIAGDRLILNTNPKQIILLGAGLDTRAHRLELPEGCQVYEIDIANTQALKRRVAEKHPQEFKGKVEYISVDFSSESFVERLKDVAASFDATCPQTVILFEGVSMYLQWPALRATLEMISGNLAPGTLVGMDCFEDMWSTPQARKRQSKLRGARILVRAVERVGEPFQWGIPEDDNATNIFSKLGFEVVADVDGKDMERLFMTPPNCVKPVGWASRIGHYVILRVLAKKQNEREMESGQGTSLEV